MCRLEKERAVPVSATAFRQTGDVSSEGRGMDRIEWALLPRTEGHIGPMERPQGWSHWVTTVVASVSTATLLRLLLNPVLGERAVFLLAVLAVALSAHLGGLSAGIATIVLAIPIAAVVSGPPAALSTTPEWLQMALAIGLAFPLAFLGGRFNRLVRQLDHALRRERAARAEAERANRARDEFLAVLSHELRSPLNAIVGWAHVLKGQDQTAETVRAIDTILRNADHQVRLMSDIADLSRGITGKLVLESGQIDVRSALDQAVDSVRLSADARKVHLQLVIPETPLVVQGDGARLRQVFWNLLSNAIKFSASGGSVQASAACEGNSVVVRVADTGQGIGAEFLPYVFDSFRQEDATRSRRQGGLGLGLAIVRHITEAHGGAVDVRSEGSGKGAVFTVTLPLSTGGRFEPFGEGDLSRPQLAGMKVLIVEDDADSRELVVRCLGELGATVVGVSSAAEARLQISKERPDAIISDIGMPEEDGLAFVRALKKQPAHRGIPAIALTAYASDRDRQDALEAGYFEHVAKPVQPYHLARAIVRAVRPPS
jgi:signal transduction histidine kinase